MKRFIAAVVGSAMVLTAVSALASSPSVDARRAARIDLLSGRSQPATTGSRAPVADARLSRLNQVPIGSVIVGPEDGETFTRALGSLVVEAHGMPTGLKPVISHSRFGFDRVALDGEELAAVASDKNPGSAPVTDRLGPATGD